MLRDLVNGAVGFQQLDGLTGRPAKSLHRMVGIGAGAGGTERGGRGRAGDVYLLPSAMAGLTLREVGLDARDLGADVPVEAIGKAARRYGARLSVEPIDPAKVMEAIEGVAEGLEGGTVVIGGRGSERLSPRPETRVVKLGTTTELAAFGEGWWPGWTRESVERGRRALVNNVRSRRGRGDRGWNRMR